MLTWLNETIEKKRKALESPNKDHGESQHLRGQIKAYRAVVAKIEGVEEEDESSG